jgi:hypothetical protein
MGMSIQDFQIDLRGHFKASNVSPPMITWFVLPAHEKNKAIAILRVVIADADASFVKAASRAMHNEWLYVIANHDSCRDLDIHSAHRGSIFTIPTAIKDTENIVLQMDCERIGLVSK